MKGFIPAAGLGSRLKPWTDFHPKALVPVDGLPMLARVIQRLQESGIEDITVNTFHFAEQIIDFLKRYEGSFHISDERPVLLETGGALLYARRFLYGCEPILIHNADILSNADLNELENFHYQSRADITLLISERESSRKLVFDTDMSLTGWHDLSSNIFRPDGFSADPAYREYAFSGIYIVSPSVIDTMISRGFNGAFSIMDFMLSSINEINIRGFLQPDLKLLDIGKPDSLNRASEFLASI